MKKLALFTSLLIVGSLSASADTITPTDTTFGTLSGATFGGSGIPNTAVAITTINTAGDAITLGLTATPRYPAPPVGYPLPNDGNGTFYGEHGVGLTLGYATWNFDFYVNLAEGAGNNNNYTFDLVYENNVTEASDVVNLGTANASVSLLDPQDSWNLGMGFLNTIGFDPNAEAQYGFELEAFNSTGLLVGESAINVNVPDDASTVGLLGFGLLGLAVFSFRQNRMQAVK